ncbi:HTH_48 domain-containing protein [Trichonephila clavipes]|nr:HTH_48 domain-containing protein [Trichonephila clavipes]
MENSRIPMFQKTLMSESKFKVMLNVFFDINEIVIEEFPSGQTVHLYIAVLKNLVKKLGRKKPQLWSDGWLLHQNNAPAHTNLCVKQVWTSKNITVIRYPPYSHRLASCDFPTVKSCLNGPHFISIEEVRGKLENLLKCIPKTSF